MSSSGALQSDVQFPGEDRRMQMDRREGAERRSPGDNRPRLLLGRRFRNELDRRRGLDRREQPEGVLLRIADSLLWMFRRRSRSDVDTD